MLGSHKAQTDSLIDDFVDGQLRTHAELLKTVGVIDKEILQILVTLKKHLANLRSDLKKYSKGNHSSQLEAKIASYGERLSAVLVAGYINASQIKAEAVLSENIPIVTDDNWKDANILYDISEKNVQKAISKIKVIPVISGFTGKTKRGAITVLGRGGTDTTACFIGATVRAKKVILWKDVAGVLSADPKIVKGASTIPTLSYAEVKESGKIVHEKSIQYLLKRNIPAAIAGLIDPKSRTEIVPSKKLRSGAKIVSYKKNLTLFALTQGDGVGYEQLFEISKIFSYYKVGIVLIWNTPDSLQIVADNKDGSLSQISRALKKKTVGVKMNLVDMVTLVGSFDWKDVNEFNTALYKAEPRTLVGAYPYPHCMRLEGIIESGNLEKVVRILHKKFIKHD